MTLPSKLISLGEAAFYQCANLAGTVTIPSGVTKIPKFAFTSCTALPGVVLNGDVTEIGADAFSECRALKSLSLPDTVTTIDASAFSSAGITSITLPESLTSIGSSAFSGSKLTSVAIPSKVTAIADSTFSACNDLTEATLPKGLTSIGGNAFLYCGALVSITLPSKLKSIGSSAFQGCTSLPSVSIPDSVISVGQEAFDSCSGLKNAVLSKGVTDIAYATFNNCTSLPSVAIPAGVTSIGKKAFRMCTSLTAVELPATLTTVDEKAFDRCAYTNGAIGSHTVTFDGTAVQWNTLKAGINTSVAVVNDTDVGNTGNRYLLESTPQTSKTAQNALTITTTTATFGTPVTLQADGGSTNKTVVWSVSSGTGDADLSGSTLTPTKAGTVTLKAVMPGDDSYQDANAEQVLTIAAKQITPAVSAIANQKYTGSPITPDVTVTADGSTLTPDADYTVTSVPAETTAVGTGKLTVAAAENGNYAFAAISVTFSIDPADSTLSLSGSLNKPYDDSAADTPAAEKTGSTADTVIRYYTNEACTALTAPADTGAAQIGGAPVNAGSYFVKASVAASGNYAAAESNVLSFTIARAPLRVAAGDKAITYGDAPANGGVSYSGFASGETEAVLAGTLSYTYSYTQYSSAGSYTITPAGLSSGNYAITFVPGTLSVGPKTVGLLWSNTASRTFGDGKSVTAAAAGTVNGDVLAVTVSGGDNTAVGEHTATATGLTGDRAASYRLPDPATVTYTIGKHAAPAGVRADFTLLYSAAGGKTVAVADFSLPADIVNAAFSGAPGAKTDADSILSAYSSTGFTLVSGLSAADSGKTASWTVTISSDNYADITAAVTVTVADKAVKAINGLTPAANLIYNGRPQRGYTGTAAAEDSAVPAADLIYTYTSTDGKGFRQSGTAAAVTAPADAGAYQLTVSIPESNTSYMGSVSLTFTIAPKNTTLSVSAVGAQTYTGSPLIPALTVTDGSAALTAGTDYTVTCADNTNAGTASCTVAGKGNYAGSTGAVRFVIRPKTITEGDFTALPTDTKVYTGSPITQAVTSPSLAAADYAVTYAGNTNAGTASYTVTGRGNYAGTIAKTFTITRRPITVTPDGGQTKRCGAADPVLTYQPDETLAASNQFSGALSRVSGETVGSYTITSGTLTAGSNYSLSLSASVSFTITAAVYTLTAIPASLYIGSTFDAAAIKSAVKDAGAVTITGVTVQKPDGTAATGADADAIAAVDAVTHAVTAKGAGKIVVTYDIAANDLNGDHIDEYTALTGQQVLLTLTSRPSSSSGSSGGSAAAPAVTVPASSDAGSVKISANVSGSVAAVAPTDAQIATVASASRETGTVVVDLSSLKVDTAVLPAKLIAAAKAADNSAGLAVLLPAGRVELDKTALAAAAGSGDVQLSVQTVPAASLTQAQKTVLGSQVNSALAVDIKLLAGGKAVTDFGGGRLTIRIPYTLKAGQNAEALVVWFLKDDGTLEPHAAVYDAGSASVTFTVTHLSRYFIAVFPFADVAGSSYYYTAVAWAVNNGITGGKTAAVFAPSAACTRAQTVTFLWRATGSPEPTSAACPFTDVDTGAYYAKAVRWAAEKGIVKGTAKTAFSPDAAVTRAQVVTFLYRAAGSPAAAGANPFGDVSADAYYADAAAWAVSQKITEGTGAAAFSPADRCTRAQIVTFLNRQLDR